MKHTSTTAPRYLSKGKFGRWALISVAVMRVDSKVIRVRFTVHIYSDILLKLALGLVSLKHFCTLAPAAVPFVQVATMAARYLIPTKKDNLNLLGFPNDQRRWIMAEGSLSVSSKSVGSLTI